MAVEVLRPARLAGGINGAFGATGGCEISGVAGRVVGAPIDCTAGAMGCTAGVMGCTAALPDAACVAAPLAGSAGSGSVCGGAAVVAGLAVDGAAVDTPVVVDAAAGCDAGGVAGGDVGGAACARRGDNVADARIIAPANTASRVAPLMAPPRMARKSRSEGAGRVGAGRVGIGPVGANREGVGAAKLCTGAGVERVLPLRGAVRNDGISRASFGLNTIVECGIVAATTRGATAGATARAT